VLRPTYFKAGLIQEHSFKYLQALVTSVSSLTLHIKPTHQLVLTLFMGDIASPLCVVCSLHTNSTGASRVFL
jgi:hypothetical protein